MKNLILLTAIILIVGCGQKHTATPESVTKSIVWENNAAREKVLALDGRPPEVQEQILQLQEVRDEVVHEVLAKHLDESFSSAELSELSKIYDSEVMIKLQNLLYSYEYNQEIGKLTQERLDALHSEPIDADNQ